MKPLVVLQNNFVHKLTVPAKQAADTLGIDTYDVSSGEDFVGKHPMPLGDQQWGPILVIGSITFAQQWAENRPDLRKWLDWTDYHYDASEWANRFGADFLNYDGGEMTIGEFLDSRIKGKFHIRPRSEMKMVGWKVVDENTAGQQSVAGNLFTRETLAPLMIDPDTTIWVSFPKKIYAEVRVWFTQEEVIGTSTYRVMGEPVASRDHILIEGARAFAQHLNDQWEPNNSYVADVALTDDGWKLVEFNPIHAAGWYGADVASIISKWFELNGETNG